MAETAFQIQYRQEFIAGFEQLQSLLDEALEANQGLQEPIIDSFQDL